MEKEHIYIAVGYQLFEVQPCSELGHFPIKHTIPNQCREKNKHNTLLLQINMKPKHVDCRSDFFSYT